MPKFFTQQEAQQLRNAAPDSLQAKLYYNLKSCVYQNTKVPGFKQPHDTKEWWYLVPRCEDAAFVWYMERDPKLAEWIRHIAFWLLEQEDTEWIGPWFRNKERPLVGQLETAAISIALCSVLDIAEELFTAEEKAALEKALKERGMTPCKRFCDNTLQDSSHITNFMNVILSGYGNCALYFKDDAASRWAIAQLKACYQLYNEDCYGETLHYSNYASVTLARMNELALRMRPDLENEIDLDCYSRLMNWYASSYLYMKNWNDEIVYPRFFSTGDSGATFRPNADLMAHIAVRMKEKMPEKAALASWLFHTTYAPFLGTDLNITDEAWDNQYSFRAVLLMPNMPKPQSPAELGMDTIQLFENGEMFIRDSWENSRGALAIQAGYQPLNVTAHRHEDNGSFQFAMGKERMIIDGATTCYRLFACQFTKSTCQHSVFDFLREPQAHEFNHVLDPFEGVIRQKLVNGNYAHPKPVMVKNILNEKMGNVHVLTMDLTDDYPDEITLARRAIVSALPHAVFIIDQAETADSLRMRTHFPMNNRDNKLKTHRADEHRYVFRRNGEAMKIFECEAYLDGEKTPSKMEFAWGYANQRQSIFANLDAQAKEGSLEIYNWVDQKPCKKHLRICAIAADRDEFIKGWHIKPDQDGNWYIESPQKEKWLTVKAEGDHVYLLQNGKKKTIL